MKLQALKIGYPELEKMGQPACAIIFGAWMYIYQTSIYVNPIAERGKMVSPSSFTKNRFPHWYIGLKLCYFIVYNSVEFEFVRGKKFQNKFS